MLRHAAMLKTVPHNKTSTQDAKSFLLSNTTGALLVHGAEVVKSRDSLWHESD